MNLLLLLPEEFIDEGKAQVSGPRAKEIQTLHQLKQGLSLQVGVLGSKIGLASVDKICTDKITFSVELSENPPPRAGVSLLVGACRPQTTKKLLEFSATAGIDELHFIRTSLSDKNYLDSKVLLESEMNKFLLKGLEQGVDTILPTVFVHRFFEGFLESYNEPEGALKFIGSTASDERKVATVSASKSTVLAIGPESGWSSHELLCFNERGYQSVSLGPRQYRIEQAACMLVGQIIVANS